MSQSEPRTIVAIFAHPDDEIICGGTLAEFARTCHVVLVSATRGELGEISDPSLATPETLGDVREGELRAACRELGVSDVRFLGYRDSGMAGTPGNQDARSLVQADREQAVGRVVALLQELRPGAVITWEESGGYGHPDHITTHEVVRAAYQAAGEPGRLFYAGFPRSALREMARRAAEANVDTGVFAELDIEQLGIPDDEVDVVRDVSDEVERKQAAMRAHRTQFREDRPWEEASEEELRQFFGREYFQLGGGTPIRSPRPVHDLFAP